MLSHAGCVYSWGGGDMPRGWAARGPSGGHGPARRVGGALASDAQRVLHVAGSRNSMAVGADHRVYTWGLNDSKGGGDAWFVRGGHVSAISDSGQLGRRDVAPGSPPQSAAERRRRRRSASPFAPAAIVEGALGAEGAIAIASGRYHALAVGKLSRAVYSWGLNSHGQLGRTGFRTGHRGVSR